MATFPLSENHTPCSLTMIEDSLKAYGSAADPPFPIHVWGQKPKSGNTAVKTVGDRRLYTDACGSPRKKAVDAEGVEIRCPFLVEVTCLSLAPEQWVITSIQSQHSPACTEWLRLPSDLQGARNNKKKRTPTLRSGSPERSTQRKRPNPSSSSHIHTHHLPSYSAQVAPTTTTTYPSAGPPASTASGASSASPNLPPAIFPAVPLATIPNLSGRGIGSSVKKEIPQMYPEENVMAPAVWNHSKHRHPPTLTNGIILNGDGNERGTEGIRTLHIGPPRNLSNQSLTLPSIPPMPIPIPPQNHSHSNSRKVVDRNVMIQGRSKKRRRHEREEESLSSESSVGGGVVPVYHQVHPNPIYSYPTYLSTIPAQIPAMHPSIPPIPVGRKMEYVYRFPDPTPLSSIEAELLTFILTALHDTPTISNLPIASVVKGLVQRCGWSLSALIEVGEDERSLRECWTRSLEALWGEESVREKEGFLPMQITLINLAVRRRRDGLGSVSVLSDSCRPINPSISLRNGKEDCQGDHVMTVALGANEKDRETFQNIESERGLEHDGSGSSSNNGEVSVVGGRIEIE